MAVNRLTRLIHPDIFTRLDPIDVLEPGLGAPFREQGQKFGHARQIRPDRDIRQGVQALGHGGEGEQSVLTMIVQRLGAEGIARQRQLAVVRIPDGKGVVAVDMIEKSCLPALPCGQEQPRVGTVRSAGGIKTQRGRQPVPVIETHIGYQMIASAITCQGRGIKPILVKAIEPAQTEGDVAAVPEALTIGTVESLGRVHGPARFGGSSPVQTPYARKRRHCVSFPGFMASQSAR